MAAPVFSTGDIPTATQVNTWFTNILWARKTANTDRTSTTTFADDPDLTLAVEAGAVYDVRAVLSFHSSSQTASDYKFKFTAPASSTLLAGAVFDDNTGTTLADVVISGLTLNNSPSGGIIQTVEPWNPVLVLGTLVVGSAGNFTLQWAQNTSSATVTRLQAHSSLRLTRME